MLGTGLIHPQGRLSWWNQVENEGKGHLRHPGIPLGSATAALPPYEEEEAEEEM